METTREERSSETAAMARAWETVCPAAHAKKLAAEGWISEAQAAEKTWRDRIVALVTKAELAAAGTTIEEVKAAIVFYTATEATVTEETVGERAEPGYFVLADGYRKGPAGDH